MNKRLIRFTACFLVICALIWFSGIAEAKQKTPPILGKVKKDLNNLLTQMDKDLAATAKIIGKTSLNSKEARSAMQDIQSKYSFVIDCCTINPAGKIVAAEPQSYKSAEGKDISSQAQFIQLKKTHKPVISKLFFSVEGLDALDFEHPVFDKKGKFLGSVSLLIDSEKMFGSVIDIDSAGIPVDVWVIQTDGTTLFDPDREEVGRSLLTDPIYKPHKKLVETVERIISIPDGHQAFYYKALGRDKTALVEATWTTAIFHGIPWRLVVTHTRTGDAQLGIRTLSSLGLEKADEALRKLANNPDFINAAELNDKTAMMKFLTAFFKANKGLYSVQWADNNQINRFGYPEENSLLNYDFKSENAISSSKTLAALKSQKETVYEESLIEGKNGIYFMVPVFKETKYLGAVYYIVLKTSPKSR